MTVPRIYLDANVFVAAYETRGARSTHAWWILEAIEAGEFAGMTSELTLAEVLVGALLDNDDELASRYRSIIAPADGFAVAAVDRRTLIESALLRGLRRSLKLPDAIHVATARLNECRFLVSDDRRLPFAPGVQLVLLGAHAIDVMRGATS